MCFQKISVVMVPRIFLPPRIIGLPICLLCFLGVFSTYSLVLCRWISKYLMEKKSLLSIRFTSYLLNPSYFGSPKEPFFFFFCLSSIGSFFCCFFFSPHLFIVSLFCFLCQTKYYQIACEKQYVQSWGYLRNFLSFQSQLKRKIRIPWNMYFFFF